MVRNHGADLLEDSPTRASPEPQVRPLAPCFTVRSPGRDMSPDIRPVCFGADDGATDGRAADGSADDGAADGRAADGSADDGAADGCAADGHADDGATDGRADHRRADDGAADRRTADGRADDGAADGRADDSGRAKIYDPSSFPLEWMGCERCRNGT